MKQDNTQFCQCFIFYPSSPRNLSIEQSRKLTSIVPNNIKKVAVLGTGVMGSQIAAHLSNAKIEVYAFDINQGNLFSIF